MLTMAIREFVCEYCGKKFSCEWRSKQTDRKFCSITCSCRHRAEAKSARVRRENVSVCAHCGKKFYRRGHPKYCSRKCSSLAKIKHEMKACLSCGKTFKPRDAKTIYCSLECRDAGGKIEKECAYCGAKFMVHRCVDARSELAGSFCSRDCCNLYRSGENNSNWRGGLSFGEYGAEFNTRLKESVREAWGRKCAICSVPEKNLGESLSVHHIDYDKSNSDFSNLIPLCRKCHLKTNSWRPRWTGVLERAIGNNAIASDTGIDTNFLYYAKILSITDGDTIKAEVDLGFNVSVREIFRLYGINAPETRGTEKESGLESKEVLKDWCDGQEVVIETIKDKKGKYGRYLAILWLDGESLNDRLVQEGYAAEADY